MKFHALAENLKGRWPVKADKNYRIIFWVEGENVYEVDYIDYH